MACRTGRAGKRRPRSALYSRTLRNLESESAAYEQARPPKPLLLARRNPAFLDTACPTGKTRSAPRNAHSATRLRNAVDPDQRRAPVESAARQRPPEKARQGTGRIA